MNTSALLTRTRAILEANALMWPDREVVEDGLNPALILVALLKPEFSTARTPITLNPEQCFLDLRTEAPRLLRLHRVTLDVYGDLRPASWENLIRRRGLLSARRHRPTMWARYGRHWLILWPRAVVSHTVTLVHTATPAPLSWLPLDMNRAPELPEAVHDLIPEVAADLLMMKHGGLDAEQGIQRLATHFGDEALTPMAKAVGAARRQAERMLPDTAEVGA